MSLEIGIGQTLFPTSDGTMDFTSSRITKTTKIAMPFITDAEINGTFMADADLSIGGTNGSVQGCFSMRAVNGGASASISRRQPNNETLLRNPSEGAGHQKLTHNSFLSNGWRANATLTGAFQKLPMAIMFAGDSIVRQEALIMAANTAVDVEQTFNFLDSNLLANVLFFTTVGTNEAAGQTSFGTPSFGIAVRQPDGSFKQRNMLMRVDVDGAASGNPAAIINTDRIASAILNNDAIQWELELSEINKGNIKFIPRVGSVSGDEILIIAMEIKGHHVGLEDFTLPTSTGVYQNTDFGFKPDWVFNVHSMLTAFDAGSTGSDAGVMAFSTFNDTEKFCYSINNEDAAATINCDSVCHDRVMFFPFHNGVVGSGASGTTGFDSATNNPTMTDLGYDITLDTVNTTGRVGFGLAIGQNIIPILRRREEDSYQGV